MYEATYADSPLTRAPRAQAHELRVEEEAFLGYLNLRGPGDDPAFIEAVRQAAGLALPTGAGEAVVTERMHALWLGPSEWLLVTAPEAQQALAVSLEETLAGHFAGITDVSGYYTALSLSGGRARELLARGCPLDLHPRVFGPGRCSRTLFAKAAVILQQVDEIPQFRLLVRRSFADYVWCWLHDAMGGLDGPRGGHA